MGLVWVWGILFVWVLGLVWFFGVVFFVRLIVNITLSKALILLGWKSSSPPFAIPMLVMAQDAGPTGNPHPPGPVVRYQAKCPGTVKTTLNA